MSVCEGNPAPPCGQEWPCIEFSLGTQIALDAPMLSHRHALPSIHSPPIPLPPVPPYPLLPQYSCPCPLT